MFLQVTVNENLEWGACFAALDSRVTFDWKTVVASLAHTVSPRCVVLVPWCL